MPVSHGPSLVDPRTVRADVLSYLGKCEDKDTCAVASKQLSALASSCAAPETVAAVIYALASETAPQTRKSAGARVAVMRTITTMCDKNAPSQKHIQPHVNKLATLCAACAGATGADASTRTAAADALQAMARHLPSAWIGPDGAGTGGPLLRPVIALAEKKANSRDEAAALLDAAARVVRGMQPALRPEVGVVRAFAKTQTSSSFAAKGSALLALAACGPAAATHAADAIGAPNTAAATARGGLAGVLRHAEDWRERRAAAEAAEVFVLLARDALADVRVPATGGGWCGALEAMAALLVEARHDRVRPVRDAAISAAAALTRAVPGIRIESATPSSARRRGAVNPEFKRAHAWPDEDGSENGIVVMLPPSKNKVEAASAEQEVKEGARQPSPAPDVGLSEEEEEEEEEEEQDDEDVKEEKSQLEHAADNNEPSAAEMESAPLSKEQSAPRRRQWGGAAAPVPSSPLPSSSSYDLPAGMAAAIASAVSEALRPHVAAIERRLSRIEGRVAELEDTVVDLIEERRAPGGVGPSDNEPPPSGPPPQPPLLTRPETPLSRAREVYRDLRALLELAPTDQTDGTAAPTAAILTSAADAFEGAADALASAAPHNHHHQPV
ncbi:hypothetical protein PPROV_001069000 [Pycnococcus provasolii]|uniref:TORTIFOLIA1/SINE1-2 N-terminal domain-containing protein n=1 Tax=Pycnococcus provasolii TaxID=41880 RepID=A0A830HYS7_9CHLO|nr:hypothetical protein PPROV_001069000 [Pycnococcus provasolii]